MIYTETGASDFLLQCLDGLPDGATLLEVGTLRNVTDAARISDGWGTLTLAEWASEHNGEVVTIDIRSRAQQLRQIIGVRMDRVQHLVGDAEILCRSSQSVFDFAYLDGPNDAAMHYRIAQTLAQYGTRRIAFDDAEVKAPTAIEYLRGLDWTVLVDNGRHICMEAPNAV